MLGRYSMADNARVVLATSINSVANTITFNAAVAPFNNPANPTGDAASGGFGIATLTDSLTQPTKFEIVLYDAVDNNGDGTFSLRHCVRGAAGSTAQSWTAGAVIYQALTAQGLLHPFITVDQVIAGGAVNVAAALNVTGGAKSTWTPNFGSTYSSAHASGFESSDSSIGVRAAFYGNTSYFAGSSSEAIASFTALVGANSTAGPRFALAKGRGIDGNTAVQVNDELGSIRWYARHASSNWAQPARIVSTVASISGAAVKVSMLFQVSPDGTSAPGTVLTLSHNGSVYNAAFAGNVSVGGAMNVVNTATFQNTLNCNGTLVSQGVVFFDSSTEIAAGALQWRLGNFGSAGAGGTVNNWNPTNLATARIIRITGSATTFTGLIAPATSGGGNEITFFNTTGGAMTLSHENASSTAANRFSMPGSVNFTLPANDSVTLWYDSSSQRWRVKR